MSPPISQAPVHVTVDSIDIDRFLDNPIEHLGDSLTRVMSLPPDTLAALHRAGMKKRFEQFRHSIPMLSRLADNEGVNQIDKVEDVLPLLFDHATYKSYPASLLEKQRFPQLTTWLGKLTTLDISKVDTTACRTVDDWVLTLNRETPLSVCHTSGTSGTLSFLPWTKKNYRNMIREFPVFFFQEFGEIAPPPKLPLNIPCIYPFFRYGGTAHTIVNDYFVEWIAGTDERFHAAYPGRLSSDLMLLAARRRSAIAKGQLDRLEIAPELEARRAEFEAQQRDMPQHVANYFANMRTRLAGQRVFMMATANLLYTMAEDGLKQGMRGIFAPDSVVVSGGGGKGIVLPDNWQDPVKEFFGIKRINLGYGMSEMSGTFPLCEHGHYHSLPWVIPFILDSDTGKPLPRSGVTTGRFAFYDLMPDTRWGGFITGDEVTMTWDAPCPCGRTTPYLDSKIQRFSEKKNGEGEEKITCAATPGAYEEALDFLNQESAG